MPKVLAPASYTWTSLPPWHRQGMRRSARPGRHWATDLRPHSQKPSRRLRARSDCASRSPAEPSVDGNRLIRRGLILSTQQHSRHFSSGRLPNWASHHLGRRKQAIHTRGARLPAHTYVCHSATLDSARPCRNSRLPQRRTLPRSQCPIGTCTGRPPLLGCTVWLPIMHSSASNSCRRYPGRPRRSWREPFPNQVF